MYLLSLLSNPHPVHDMASSLLKKQICGTVADKKQKGNENSLLLRIDLDDFQQHVLIELNLPEYQLEQKKGSTVRHRHVPKLRYEMHL